MRLALFTLISLLSAAALAADDWGVRRQFVLGGAGGWDYLTADPAAQRLFIARADRVLVISTTDGSLLGTIAHTDGVHGIALAPGLGKGFISDGRADTVTVFDLKSLSPLGTFAVSGHNPDAILYDAASGHLFTFNGRSHDITMLDPVSGKIIATTPAGGKPEFAQADGRGHVFFNIEDTGQLGELDAGSGALLATWPLGGCEEPTGLAVDVAHQRLFSACGNRMLAVTDALSGRHVASVPIGPGPDAAAFDTDRGLVFTSNGEEGTLTVIHEDDPDHYAVTASVATQRSARTMALDPVTHRIYTVAAQFGAAPAASAANPHPRAAVVEGSFRVLVIGN